MSNDVIAAGLDARASYLQIGQAIALAQLPGFESQARGGRPPHFPAPTVVVQVKVLACELPPRSQPVIPNERTNVRPFNSEPPESCAFLLKLNSGIYPLVQDPPRPMLYAVIRWVLMNDYPAGNT